jgi:hypothetical protein
MMKNAQENCSLFYRQTAKFIIRRMTLMKCLLWREILKCFFYDRNQQTRSYRQSALENGKVVGRNVFQLTTINQFNVLDSVLSLHRAVKEEQQRVEVFLYLVMCF